MKIKNICIFAILLCVSCNQTSLSNDVNSNLNSSYEDISSDKGELKAITSINSYSYFSSNLDNKVIVLNNFNKSIINYYNGILPDFCLAGDEIKMFYYGEIIGEIPIPTETDSSGNMYDNGIIEYTLNGEIERFEYKKAEVKSVPCKIELKDNKYVFNVEDYYFDFILIDDKYNACSASQYSGEDNIYASYYDGKPRAVYAFDPLQ